MPDVFDHVSFATVGILVVCLAAFISFLLSSTVSLMAIFDRLWPKQQQLGSDAPVRLGDLNAAIAQINLKIDTMASRDTVTALSTRMLALEQATTKSETYAHESIHRINTTMQTLVNRVDVLGVKMDTHLGWCDRHMRRPPIVKEPTEDEN